MKNTFILIFITFTNITFAQDFYTEFKKSFQTGDTLKQKQVLQKWEKSNPNDAELFTSYYNYYFQKSKKEVISLSNREPTGDALILKDSLNNTAGYFASTENYNDKDLKQAFKKIDAGIRLYPNRLDMRFGKIYAFGKIEDWDKFTSEIMSTVEYSVINKNDWTWTNNIKKEDGEDFLLSSIQSYQLQLYNTERDDLLPNMRKIAQTILKYYPNNVESLSNVSITYFIVGEFDKGLEALHKAEKINPKDFIVLSNIAHGYKQKGNKTKAIEYYEKTIEYGDEEAKEFATSQLAELKK